MYDLAGSTVIHSTGGWAFCSYFNYWSKKRRYTKEGGIRVIPASNIPLVTLGAFYCGLDGLDLMVEVLDLLQVKRMQI